MKNWWIKLGCFLIGYNYFIVKNSSEASAKSVKKYLAAMIIIMTIWGAIGFKFADRYLHTEMLGSIIGALAMVIIIIQIERQIILNVGKGWTPKIFRIIIGIIMAIIGSVILDQVMFKDDVDKAKIASIQNEVDSILPKKSKELNSQIESINFAINLKEEERTNVINEVSKKPMISSFSSTSQYQKDSTGKMKSVNKSITNQSVANPKADLIPQIDDQLKNLRKQKTDKEDYKLNMQKELQEDLESKVGFLDELKLLFSILLSSPIALIVWILIFLFFLSIELFILFIKYGDDDNDYDRTVLHQMEIRIKMLEKLTEPKTI